MSQFVYPETRRDDTILGTYGTEKVADPYQWLEDPDSEETQVCALLLFCSTVIYLMLGLGCKSK